MEERKRIIQQNKREALLYVAYIIMYNISQMNNVVILTTCLLSGAKGGKLPEDGKNEENYSTE